MKLVSINIAKPESLQVGNKNVTTGIFKRPVSGAVAVSELGLEGDTIVHTDVHGGTDQALYLYSEADYNWWGKELGRPMEAGLFGENLTISDYHEGDLRIGDRLTIGGDVILEITAPRVPCSQFASKMGDSKFGKKFVVGKRPGAYARVIQTGTIEAGADIEWLPTTEDYATIEEVFVEWHQKQWSQAIAKKALMSPISKIARGMIEERSGVSV